MTRYAKTKNSEVQSIAELLRICAEAGVILRLISTDDVGIDAHVEVIENGTATGILIGVQLKSTDTSQYRGRYRFTADQDHFGYWARCSIPVIGVVFCLRHKKAVWTDLTGAASYERITNGPYTISMAYDEQDTAFTPSTLTKVVIPRMLTYVHLRHTTWEIQELVRPRREEVKSILSTHHSLSDNLIKEKEKAWTELVGIMFDTISTDEEVADAGYRVSWYFPTVSRRQQDYVRNAFLQLTDFQLLRLIRAINLSLEHNAEPMAEPLMDLVVHAPGITARIEQLLIEKRIPANYMEAAVQAIEYIEGRIREDLREAESHERDPRTG
jgi:hypothetical protein